MGLDVAVVGYCWWCWRSGGGCCGDRLFMGGSCNICMSAIVRCIMCGEGGSGGGGNGEDVGQDKSHHNHYDNTTTTNTTNTIPKHTNKLILPNQNCHPYNSHHHYHHHHYATITNNTLPSPPPPIQPHQYHFNLDTDDT